MRKASDSGWTAALVAWALVLAAALPAVCRAADKQLCVEVVLKDESEAAAAPVEEAQPTEKTGTAGPALPWQRAKARATQLVPEEAEAYLPIGQTPVIYLKRLIEHFITHRKGYIAVQKGCDEHIRVELYPLAEGWTLFARYTGNGREERVDQLYPRELSQFSERVVEALLGDMPISATIKRDTVLRSDSKKSAQRIKGTNHFIIGLGTQVRGGQLDTVDVGSGGTKQQIRVLAPMIIGAGYRGKFENWGIEALAQVGVGTSKTASGKNPEGGHIDFGGDAGLALHFLGYLNPRGLTSFYLGAGANFELLWFSAVKPPAYRDSDDRTTLLSGGLDVDLICGWEFMRASSVQFFLQGEINLPAYVIENEDDFGAIHTWFPGISVKLGVVF